MLTRLKMVDLGFFVVLLPAFLMKMNIPSAVVKHISKEKPSIKTAKLVSPSEESWHLHVYRKNKGAVMYFGGRTWLDFVAAHNLKPGYFLVFSYRGDMIFHFRAYDLSTCEITSYFKATNIQGQKDNCAKVEAEKHIEFKEEIESYDEIGDHVKKRKLSSPSSLRKKTQKFNVKDVQKGEYEVTVCSSHLTHYYMVSGTHNIPCRFSDTFSLSELNEITLKDPLNRMWRLRLLHRRISWGNSRNACGIGTPWTEFARANNLKVGDACIFRVCSNKRTGEAKYMKVDIRRMNET